MAPKISKKTHFYECDSCEMIMYNKDIDRHNCSDYPPLVTYNFIKTNSFYGKIELITEKENEVLSTNSKSMIFLSQPVIQLCGLFIGEWAMIEVFQKVIAPVARIVWPTSEKSVTSVSLTKKGLDSLTEATSDNFIKISKITSHIENAKEIVLIPVGSNKTEICSDLLNRIHNSYLNTLLCMNNTINIVFFGRKFQFKILKISNEKFHNKKTENIEQEFDKLTINTVLVRFYKICENSTWTILSSEQEFFKETFKKNTLSKIGGLEKEINEIKELINIALGKSYHIPGLNIIRSIILHGLPGNGKTLLANALAEFSTAHVININLTEIYSHKDVSPEETVNRLYQEALSHVPSVIVIDDIDTLCPSKSGKLNESEKRIAASLIKIFTELHENDNSKIFIIATTNKIDSVDSSLRKSGRLDKEIEITVSGPIARLEILKKILKSTITCSGDELFTIARAAHGFVGSDLEALCSIAALNAGRRTSPNILLEDLEYGLKKTVPSAMREVQIEIPNVKWSEIGGQEKLKLVLQQAVEWPLKYPQVFSRMGIKPRKGVLMFGPPGCSKTMIARALATESNLNFLAIKGPELFSKWVGESEKAVRDIFKKARQVAPAIIFFDEIDAIGGERTSGSSTSVQERVLAQLLTELDGITSLGDITILAATNRPDRIDRALLRPGRLDRIVYVPLPESHTRLEIFKIKRAEMPFDDTVNLDELVARTEGYSGAEVNAVCQEAAMVSLEQNIDAKTIESKHFSEALKIIFPRTPKYLLDLYSDFTN